MDRVTRNIYLIFLLLAIFHSNTPVIRGLSLKLVPWASLYPENITPLHKDKNSIGFPHILEPMSSDSPNVTVNGNKIQIPVRHRDFHYSVNIKIGTPSKEVKLLFDTGSAFIWTQCAQKLNTYNPVSSNTYKPLPCNHRLCAKKMCKCIKNQCVCSISYGSSGVKYTLAGSLDTFLVPISNQSEIAFPEIVFGCSNNQPLNNFSGILGMDRTPFSLLVQLRSQTRGRFSYCLHSGTSYLTLGKDIPNPEGKHVKTTPLIHTNRSALLLNLTDKSVAGKRLGVSPSLFSMRNSGVFLDTGTMYTILEKKAYEKVNKAFASYFKRKLERLPGSFYSMEPCYKMIPGFKDFPTMTFHFQGADLVMKNTHIAGGGVACTALTKGSRTVIGVMQQWNTRLMFDINANLLKFYSDDCSKDIR